MIFETEAAFMNSEKEHSVSQAGVLLRIALTAFIRAQTTVYAQSPNFVAPPHAFGIMLSAAIDGLLENYRK